MSLTEAPALFRQASALGMALKYATKGQTDYLRKMHEDSLKKFDQMRITCDLCGKDMTFKNTGIIANGCLIHDCI